MIARDDAKGEILGYAQNDAKGEGNEGGIARDNAKGEILSVAKNDAWRGCEGALRGEDTGRPTAFLVYALTALTT